MTTHHVIHHDDTPLPSHIEQVGVLRGDTHEYLGRSSLSNHTIQLGNRVERVGILGGEVSLSPSHSLSLSLSISVCLSHEQSDRVLVL